ncbi:MAG: hypothetical protein AB7F08_01605 [Dongiaceae bacterium]
MGLLDWPGGLFAWLDRQADFLPPAFRLALWALFGAVLSMALYKAFSPQRRIAAAEAAARSARQALDRFEGEFVDAWPLMRRSLAAALHRLALVLPATLLASLPLFAMILWLSTSYGYEAPSPGQPVPVLVTPPQYEGELLTTPSGAAPLAQGRVRVKDPAGVVVADIPLQKPVPSVEKHRWWHLLIGNPAGYLPAEGAIERIDLQLSPQQYLPLGPGWLRGWELPFFTVLLLGSIAIKKFARIA